MPYHTLKYLGPELTFLIRAHCTPYPGLLSSANFLYYSIFPFSFFLIFGIYLLYHTVPLRLYMLST